jgi:hypothetical protein
MKLAGGFLAYGWSLIVCIFVFAFGYGLVLGADPHNPFVWPWFWVCVVIWLTTPLWTLPVFKLFGYRP